MSHTKRSLSWLLLVAGACSDGGKPASGTEYLDPGTPVPGLSARPDDREALHTLSAELQQLEGLSSAQLLERRAPAYASIALGYDPEQALHLDLIQNSTLALNAGELGKLKQQGFAIAPRHAFPNAAYGYRTIYALDLPVYVSLDAIMTSVHLSYDAILASLEQTFLSEQLETMLVGGRARLAAGVVADHATARDLDLYLTVALSLLKGRAVAPAKGASAAEIGRILAKAQAGRDILDTELFGAVRAIDYSQFEPRGHYTNSEQLKRYFRASMWLGRTDLRLIETLSDGKQVFRRRQLAAALALHDVIVDDARSAFDRIDRTLGAFVGEHDAMQLADLDGLVDDLGGTSLDGFSDQELAQTIIDKGYGAQRIASQVIFKSGSVADETLPLDRSFALLGQRYTVDSHVFSRVVYDRVVVPNAPHRFLPSGLDVAYAALGNSAALPLLESELTKYQYASHLESMRTLVDAHGDDYWSGNLYNLWLSALRAASPGAELSDPAAHGLPAMVGSDAWQRRVLNTQLSSWAELRHDTLLYVKQSYTSGNACEFPDGYVDPYPEAFERLRLYALQGQEIGALLPAADRQGIAARVQSYFTELAAVSAMLRDMAKAERSGAPFNAEQMAFLNDAVKSQAEGCDGPSSYEGWYARLLFDKSDDDMDPTIADVHTDPGGTREPKVLHVATGLPRLMVVTVDSCQGPRAYAGVVNAYHEVVTGLDRMTDEEWAPKAKDEPFVPWFNVVLP